MIYGTTALDIHSRIPFIMLLFVSLICSLSHSWTSLLPIKAMPYERYMITPILLQENILLVLLILFTMILSDLCPQNPNIMHVMFSHSWITIQIFQLLYFYTQRMLSYNTLNQWFLGPEPLSVTCSPLYIQIKGENLWLGCYKYFFNPKESLITPLFPTLPNKMIVQRGSIKLCLLCCIFAWNTVPDFMLYALYLIFPFISIPCSHNILFSTCTSSAIYLPLNLCLT